MKNWIYLMLGAATALFIAACGKDGGSSNKNNVVGAQACQAGYVYTTQYGCLPQSTCPPGYGMYQNQCYQGTINNGSCQAGYIYSSQYGCLQQAHCQPGSGLYNGQCVYVDSYYNGGYNGGYYNGGYYNGGYIPYYPNYPQQQWGWGAGYQRYCYWYYGQMMCQ